MDAIWKGVQNSLKPASWHRIEERPEPQGVGVRSQLESAAGAAGQVNPNGSMVSDPKLSRNWQITEGTQINPRGIKPQATVCASLSFQVELG
jgi:hypothetical protein